jgi:transcriptional regulator with XRE-family HTH domain
VTLGERIKEARQQRGLTQEQLARRSGLTLNAYGDIERGHITDPHYSSLRGIARGLGITVAELVEESAPKAEAPRPSPETAGAKPPPVTVDVPPLDMHMSLGEVREHLERALQLVDAGQVEAAAAEAEKAYRKLAA